VGVHAAFKRGFAAARAIEITERRFQIANLPRLFMAE
jgi:hypothetical protein